jgi:hypothetical protein
MKWDENRLPPVTPAKTAETKSARATTHKVLFANQAISAPRSKPRGELWPSEWKFSDHARPWTAKRNCDGHPALCAVILLEE